MAAASQQAKLKRMVSMPSEWVALRRSGDASRLDVDRYDLTQRFRVQARDLRVLDPLLSCPSAILGRRGAVVLNLEKVKAVITRDEVLLRDPSDDAVVPLVEELRRRLAAEDGIPFELRALEALLEGACAALDARATELEAEAYPFLDELARVAGGVGSRGMDRARRMKGAVARLAARTRRVRDELERLLDDEQDMAGLCLSGADRVDQVEMILEAYYMEVEATWERVKRVRKSIEATEECVNIQMDNRRNRLIMAKQLIEVANLCLSLHSLVAATLGMSIPNPWKDHRYAYVFKWVVTATTAACFAVYVGIMTYARRKGIMIKSFFSV